MTTRPSGRLAVAPDLHDRLLALEARATRPPTGPADALAVADAMIDAAGELAGAPVTRKRTGHDIEATRRSGHVAALGPDLALTATLDDGDGVRSARLAVADAAWQVEAGASPDERRVRVSVHGDLVADWTWTGAGDVVDNTDREAALADAAAGMAESMQAELPDLGPSTSVEGPDDVEGAEQPQEEEEPAEEEPAEEAEEVRAAEEVGPWAATHRVGDTALAVGGVPTGTVDPGTMLAAGLEVRHVETTPAGWALVECSNGWRCYVDARGLRPVTDRTATFVVGQAVEGRTPSGDAIWLVPGERYPLGEESGGWIATEVQGAPVWVPSWAARPH